MGSKIWDIVWVSKIMTLLIKKKDENCIENAQVNGKIKWEFKNK